MDMGSDSDVDLWIMEDTHLSELIDEEGQKLKFVFDYMTERYFYMRLKEMIPGKNLRDPLCESKVGKAPIETVDLEVYSDKFTKIETPSIDELDAEFYGDESFSDDELTDLEELDSDTLQVVTGGEPEKDGNFNSGGFNKVQKELLEAVVQREANNEG